MTIFVQLLIIVGIFDMVLLMIGFIAGYTFNKIQFGIKPGEKKHG
jgi:hypothetical protein